MRFGKLPQCLGPFVLLVAFYEGIVAQLQLVPDTGKRAGDGSAFHVECPVRLRRCLPILAELNE